MGFSCPDFRQCEGAAARAVPLCRCCGSEPSGRLLGPAVPAHTVMLAQLSRQSAPGCERFGRCRNGRAGELRGGVGSLPLATFAEVPRDTADLASIDLTEMCAIRTPGRRLNRHARPLPLRTTSTSEPLLPRPTIVHRQLVLLERKAGCVAGVCLAREAVARGVVEQPGLAAAIGIRKHAKAGRKCLRHHAGGLAARDDGTPSALGLAPTRRRFAEVAATDDDSAGRGRSTRIQPPQGVEQ